MIIGFFVEMRQRQILLPHHQDGMKFTSFFPHFYSDKIWTIRLGIISKLFYQPCYCIGHSHKKQTPHTKFERKKLFSGFGNTSSDDLIKPSP